MNYLLFIFAGNKKSITFVPKLIFTSFRESKKRIETMRNLLNMAHYIVNSNGNQKNMELLAVEQVNLLLWADEDTLCNAG